MFTNRFRVRFYMAAALIIPFLAHASQPMQEFVGFESQPRQIRVPVISVTNETIAIPDESPVCSQTIVSDRELAQRQEAAKPWFIKYWQPILGGTIGAIIGYKMGGFYGSKNNKWKTPTVLGGIALGALLGPGFALGAYGLGALSEHYWPTKLPLEITLALVGGIGGKFGWDALFPANPPKKLLEEPTPGEYLAEQKFYLETTCLPLRRFVHEQSKYQVTYKFSNTVRTIELDYDPGAYIDVDNSGNPNPPFSIGSPGSE